MKRCRKHTHIIHFHHGSATRWTGIEASFYETMETGSVYQVTT